MELPGLPHASPPRPPPCNVMSDEWALVEGTSAHPGLLGQGHGHPLSLTARPTKFTLARPVLTAKLQPHSFWTCSSVWHPCSSLDSYLAYPLTSCRNLLKCHFFLSCMLFILFKIETPPPLPASLFTFPDSISPRYLLSVYNCMRHCARLSDMKYLTYFLVSPS